MNKKRTGPVQRQMLAAKAMARRSVLSCKACAPKIEIWERHPLKRHPLKGRLRLAMSDVAMSDAAHGPTAPLMRVTTICGTTIQVLAICRIASRQIGEKVRRVPAPRAEVPISPEIHNRLPPPRAGNPYPAWSANPKGGARMTSPRRARKVQSQNNNPMQL
ncbi:hypothetical protein NLM31_06790 [Bradyrhizobium sp. CCGUVB4N]|uniref:hypothetical protein n=1 Tax=Bradyrhizobium sp. CCGUVB4N TaxID=2949631 RepID=UPI0020B21716|nr:hypothetical protein [Bradyrhizobium sp. CCGUVB4N]MCP3380125.1 hypothetical protein [Bradyrhizobium sp. CCGUVB4N]